MSHDERVILYTNRAKQLCIDLKTMDVTMTDQEYAMTVLYGLPSKYEHIIVAVEVDADDEKLTLEFVKNRLIQKEQRNMERFKAPDKQPDLALPDRTDNRDFARQISTCSHCKRREHAEPKCGQKFPHLKPGHYSFVTEALPYNDKADSDSDYEKFVCLFSLGKMMDALVGSLTPVQPFTCAIRGICLLSWRKTVVSALKWEIAQRDKQWMRNCFH